MTHPLVPPGLAAALDQGLAPYHHALDGLIEAIRAMETEDGMDTAARVAMVYQATETHAAGRDDLALLLVLAVERLAGQPAPGGLP